jgi:YegS/Rv2252/BmrU family lipid kinase
MERATLIHSPGGGSASEEDLSRASELLSARFALDVVRVSDSASPPDLARAALAAGSRLLIASGGDGTVSGVGGVLVGRADAALGIVPRGTANSIAGFLGVPSDIDEACAVVLAGHARVIDTATVNGRPMLLMATIGLHADAITGVDPARKKSLGVLAYVLEGASRVTAEDLFEITLEANGQRGTYEVSAVTLANLAPAATLLAQGPATIEADDGYVSVTIVAMHGLADALATTLHLAASALLERPADRDNIGHFRAREVRVTTRAPRRVMVDGEDAMDAPIVVRSVPRSLRVLVPPPDEG